MREPEETLQFPSGERHTSHGEGRHRQLHNPCLYHPAWLSQRQCAEEGKGQWSEKERSGGIKKCRKIWKKKGRGHCASKGMDEYFLPRVILKRRSWATAKGFPQLSFTYSLLTPHSCLIIFFVLVNMHVIYSCETINPNLFIV